MGKNNFPMGALLLNIPIPPISGLGIINIIKMGISCSLVPRDLPIEL